MFLDLPLQAQHIKNILRKRFRPWQIFISWSKAIKVLRYRVKDNIINNAKLQALKTSALDILPLKENSSFIKLKF